MAAQIVVHVNMAPMMSNGNVSRPGFCGVMIAVVWDRSNSTSNKGQLISGKIREKRVDYVPC